MIGPRAFASGAPHCAPRWCCAGPRTRARSPRAHRDLQRAHADEGLVRGERDVFGRAPARAPRFLARTALSARRTNDFPAAQRRGGTATTRSSISGVTACPRSSISGVTACPRSSTRVVSHAAARVSSRTQQHACRLARTPASTGRVRKRAHIHININVHTPTNQTYPRPQPPPPPPPRGASSHAWTSRPVT